MTTDTPETVEQEIVRKGLNGARVTPERIRDVIALEQFQRVPGTTLTFCVLTLCNGFTVTGESACADPENFNEELGRRIAREDAERKIWPLEGYLLRQAMYEADQGEVKPL